MSSKGRVDNEIYADVELAANPNAGSYFFIEGTSMWSLITTLIGLAAFLIMHSYSALRAPPGLASKSELYKLNETGGNVTVDIDVTLSELVDGHRFVSINASLVTDDLSAARTLDIEVTARNTFLKGVTTVRTDNPPKETRQVAFTTASNTSTAFSVCTFPVSAIDNAQLRISLQSNFNHITGVEFTWGFANPSSDKYNRSTKLLLSFLVGYMLVLFAFYLRFDSESFTQVYLLVIGITGVFASNPVTYFFPSVPGGKISDHILMALFLAIYKMFLVLEMEMLRSHTTAPKTILVVILGVIFAFYATVDAAASYDRCVHVSNSEIESKVVLQTEVARAILDGVYSLAIIIYFIVAALGNDGINARRLGYFGFSVFATACVLLFSDGFCVFANLWMYTAKPSLFAQSIIATLAALTLFLLHSGGGPEYVGLDKVKDADQQVIEIDQISEDGGEAAGEAGDEEEDDGEEDEEEEE
jgi:hypothetical protein